MTVVFQRSELPIAYSMIAASGRVRPRRDGGHHFEKYFYLWTAFNAIYTTIAFREGRTPQIKTQADGAIITVANGSVNIPEVNIVSEREQIFLALEEFNDKLQRNLIIHKSTKYFMNRTPSWQGIQIALDAFGQRVNGVVNVNYTSNPLYPVWSPIDFQIYERYLIAPDNVDDREFLAKQILDLLYTIRNNMQHGGKRFDDANDITVIENASPYLELIVASFTQ